MLHGRVVYYMGELRVTCNWSYLKLDCQPLPSLVPDKPVTFLTPSSGLVYFLNMQSYIWNLSLNTESYIWNLSKYAIVYLICIWKIYLEISSKSEQMHESGERVNEQACDSVNKWTVWLYFLCKIKNKINECLCDCDYYKKCSFNCNLHLSKWQFASTFNG